MTPTLTTITPYWGRSEALKRWLSAISDATVEGVHHYLFDIGGEVEWVSKEFEEYNITSFSLPDTQDNRSIGRIHNMGISIARSEWVMKLDIDALPNDRYFENLMPILEGAGEREWFNGGMLYLNDEWCRNEWPKDGYIDDEFYTRTMNNRLKSTWKSSDPDASNFIARRNEYMDLGGTENRFQGYGWEDCQVTYMLEAHQQGKCPLGGRGVDFHNCTSRCRDEIYRPKAKQLFERDHFLCLLHYYHDNSPDRIYRNQPQMNNNRAILHNYIKAKQKVISEF